MKKIIFTCLIAVSFSALSSSEIDGKAKNECKTNASQISEQFISTAFKNADTPDKVSIAGTKKEYLSLISDVCVAGYEAAKNQPSMEEMDAEAKKISRSVENPSLASGIYYAYFYGTGIYTRLNEK